MVKSQNHIFALNPDNRSILIGKQALLNPDAVTTVDFLKAQHLYIGAVSAIFSYFLNHLIFDHCRFGHIINEVHNPQCLPYFISITFIDTHKDIGVEQNENVKNQVFGHSFATSVT